MKKLTIAACCLLLAAFVFVGGWAVYQWFSVRSLAPADATAYPYGGDNTQLLLSRPAGWNRFVSSAPLQRGELPNIDGSTATIPITAEIYRQFYGDVDDGFDNNVYHSGTHPAYESLFGMHPNGKGVASLLFVTPPSQEEKDEAAKAGITLDLTPVAKDGFVFIVNRENPVDSLTVEQVRGIYSGKITNWKQVGGPDARIAAYQRNKNSGSQTAMETLVMRGQKLMKAPATKIYSGMMGIIDAVAEYQNKQPAIGYTYAYYIHNLYRSDKIKLLKIDGVAPTNAAFRDGTYPFTTAYYAAIRASEPQGSPARQLRDWLLTDDGQRLVESAGYCPGRES